MSDTTTGALFDLGFDYALSDLNFSVSVSQRVSANVLGDLLERRSVRFSMSHEVNRRETFALSANYTMQEQASDQTGGGGDDTNFASVSPSYTFALTPYWTLQFGYQFRFRDDNDGSAMSNKVFGVLSRNFVILP